MARRSACLVLLASSAAGWVAPRRAPRPPVAARSADRDFYADLGVKPSASAEEIKAAFRSKAKTLHPDVAERETVAGEARKAVYADVEKARLLLAELDADADRDGLEKELCAVVADIAMRSEDRRDELAEIDAKRKAAADAWQIVVDANEVLSDEKRRGDLDRKASAEALGDAIGTVGGVAFIGAVNVAKFGLGAVGAALKASADDGEKEKTKDDRGKEPKEKKDGKWAYD